MLCSKILAGLLLSVMALASFPVSVKAQSCNAKPLITNATGQFFTTVKYFTANLTAPENKTQFIDVVALDKTVDQVYADSVDCSLSPGSFRSLTSCSVVLDNIILQWGLVLFKCLKYSTNSVDGRAIFNRVDRYAADFCTGVCEDTPVTALERPNGKCDIRCTGNKADCNCYAPYVPYVVNRWNTLYKDASDALGKNVSVSNVTEVVNILDCGTPNITYNQTSVCLPTKITSSPTKRPTLKPTKRPTKRPTRRPTKRPVKPTRRPTKRPTKRPTHRPTLQPTRQRTIFELICDNPGTSQLCGLLTAEPDLKDALNNRDGTFTLFAPSNTAFNSFPGVKEGEVTMNQILRLHVLGQELSFDQLVNNNFYDTLFSGERTQTKTRDVFVRTVLNAYTPFITEKRQCGSGNDKGICPKIDPLTHDAVNGNILHIDSVLLPSAYADKTPSPSPKPTTKKPTRSPTKAPTKEPTKAPTKGPTKAPTKGPTKEPTENPTKKPTEEPTKEPTENPTKEPTGQPTQQRSISQYICDTPKFRIFCASLIDAKLITKFNDPQKEFTLFAPTNEAFEEFFASPGVIPGEVTLEEILLLHVLEGKVVNFDQLVKDEFYDTLLAGQQTQTKAEDVLVTNTVIRVNLQTEKRQCGPGNDKDSCPLIDEIFVSATNGIILQTDAVILPAAYADPTTSPTTSPTASNAPTAAPIVVPTHAPTGAPSDSAAPSLVPTGAPVVPSDSPSVAPSLPPSGAPVVPSDSPSVAPSLPPSGAPVVPSDSPSGAPFLPQSDSPSVAPSLLPSGAPFLPQSDSPSVAPSLPPSGPSIT